MDVEVEQEDDPESDDGTRRERFRLHGDELIIKVCAARGEA
jgi:hypothetical protein